MSEGSTPISSQTDVDDDVSEHDRASGAGTDSGTAEGTGRGGVAHSRRLLVGLALLTLALLGAAVGLGIYLLLAERKEDSREDAVIAARQEVINLFTIDYKNLDPHVQRVLDGATGDFRRDFEERSPQLRDLLVKSQVVSQGEVLQAAPVRVDDSSATVLVVAKSAVRNAAAPDGITTTDRIQVELEKKGDRWLTSSLEPVS